MAMKSISPKGMHGSKPTGVYHDILHFIGTFQDEIEQFVR